MAGNDLAIHDLVTGGLSHNQGALTLTTHYSGRLCRETMEGAHLITEEPHHQRTNLYSVGLIVTLAFLLQ